MRALICGAGLAAMLAGCALPPPAEPPQPVKPAPVVQPERETAPAPVLTRADSLLLYFAHIKAMPAADLSKEHDAVRRAYTQSHSDFNRMRLAMLLSLPNTAIYDDAKALDLLEPIVKNSKGALQGLAQLLATQLQEQRRLANSVVGMQQKLEQLKTLERALIQREQSGMKK